MWHTFRARTRGAGAHFVLHDTQVFYRRATCVAMELPMGPAPFRTERGMEGTSASPPLHYINFFTGRPSFSTRSKPGASLVDHTSRLSQISFTEITDRLISRLQIPFGQPSQVSGSARAIICLCHTDRLLPGLTLHNCRTYFYRSIHLSPTFPHLPLSLSQFASTPPP